jgi:hypothetical protein
MVFVMLSLHQAHATVHYQSHLLKQKIQSSYMFELTKEVLLSLHLVLQNEQIDLLLLFARVAQRLRTLEQRYSKHTRLEFHSS